MGEVLGLGLTHYPPLCSRDERMADILRFALADDSIPAEHRRPEAWPEAMRTEWGDDEGLSAAAVHRARLLEGFHRIRRSLDEFRPDIVVIIGDDQYENFREDVIPPYAVLAYDDIRLHPWRDAHHSSVMTGKPNVWGESADHSLEIRGRPAVARDIASGLLARGLDVAYAYRPLHHPGLSHAFLNTILFLDYDRAGFDYPVVPISVNCYGSAVISRRGFLTTFDAAAPPDPPSPLPRRLFELGAALAEVLVELPQRAAIVASSSWSHAFLCDKTWRIRPDTTSDRALYATMIDGDYASMSSMPLARLVDAGQQELLNWCVLWGAMRRLDQPLTWSTFVETSVFNSNKVFATYEPVR